jgi:WD40 repeat protein
MAELERRAKLEAVAARNDEETARNAGEMEAYIAHLTLAQSALQSDQYLEARQHLANCPESKRGWEWMFLNDKANSVLIAFGDDAKIIFHPTKQIVALTRKYEQTVEFWDFEGSQLDYSIKMNAPVINFQFSSNGEILAISSQKGESNALEFWSFDDQQRLSSCELPEDCEDEFCLLPDNKHFLVWTDRQGFLFEISGKQIGDPVDLADARSTNDESNPRKWTGFEAGPGHPFVLGTTNSNQVLFRLTENGLKRTAVHEKIELQSSGQKYVTWDETSGLRKWSISGNLLGSMQLEEEPRQILWLPKSESVAFVFSTGRVMILNSEFAGIFDEAFHRYTDIHVVPGSDELIVAEDSYYYADDAGIAFVAVYPDATQVSWSTRGFSAISGGIGGSGKVSPCGNRWASTDSNAVLDLSRDSAGRLKPRWTGRLNLNDVEFSPCGKLICDGNTIYLAEADPPEFECL